MQWVNRDWRWPYLSLSYHMEHFDCNAAVLVHIVNLSRSDLSFWLGVNQFSATIKAGKSVNSSIIFASLIMRYIYLLPWNTFHKKNPDQVHPKLRSFNYFEQYICFREMFLINFRFFQETILLRIWIILNYFQNIYTYKQLRNQLIYDKSQIYVIL